MPTPTGAEPRPNVESPNRNADRPDVQRRTGLRPPLLPPVQEVPASPPTGGQLTLFKGAVA